MRLALHPRQVEPVVAVGQQHLGIARVHLGEELERPLGAVPRRVRAQGRLEVVAQRADLGALEESHVLRDRGSVPARPLLGRVDRLLPRQGAILLLLEGERSAGAGKFARHQRHLVRPRVREELHVRQVPVVVGDADAGGRGLRRHLLLHPLRERGGRLLRGVGSRDELRMARRLALQLRERVGLIVQAARAVDPEVVTVAGEVGPRLREELRDRREPPCQLRRFLRAQGKRVLPEIDTAPGKRPLARGLVALVRIDRDVKRGIALPGAEHPVVEGEPVHLRAHEVPVDLLGHRPARRVEFPEPRLPRGQLAPLRIHRGGAVVRHAVDEPRPLECAPLGEEGDELRMVPRFRHAGEREGAEEHGQSDPHEILLAQQRLFF